MAICEKCGATSDVKTFQYTAGSKKGQRINFCAACRKKLQRKKFLGLF